MAWEVQYGDKLDLLRKMAAREGKLPSSLAGEPKVSLHALPYLSAFKRLHSSRIIGPGGIPSGIPLSEIEAYARIFNFTDIGDRQDLVHYVKVCDEAWLTEAEKRRASGNAVKHTPSRGRQPGHGYRFPRGRAGA